jgi:hypothetical protein
MTGGIDFSFALGVLRESLQLYSKEFTSLFISLCIEVLPYVGSGSLSDTMVGLLSSLIWHNAIAYFLDSLDIWQGRGETYVGMTPDDGQDQPCIIQLRMLW